jgi:hypothetical protein
MKGLDYSKFKKIACDNQVTTLEHADGHQLRIAHGSLSPKMRAELEKLPIHKAKGGAVKRYSGESNDPSDQVVTAADDPETQQAPVRDLGTDVSNIGSKVYDWAKDAGIVPDPLKMPAKAQGPGIADVSDAAPQPDQPPPQDPGLADASSATPDQGASDTPDETPAQPAAAAAATSNASTNTPSPSLPPQPDEAAVANLPPLGEQLKQEDNQYAQMLASGTIKPETMQSMFDNKSLPGKIGTIFGLLLSGAGSGLAHQNNALLGVMQQELDRDLDAQKQTAANKINIYNAVNAHQNQIAQQKKWEYENAETKARTQWIGPQAQANIVLLGANARHADADAKIATDSLSQMINNRHGMQVMIDQYKAMPEGPDKQAAGVALGMIGQQLDAKNINTADKATALQALSRSLTGGQATGGGGGDANEQNFQQRVQQLKVMGQGDYAKNLEEHHMPGVPGQSGVPLTSDDRNYNQSAQYLQQATQRLIDFTKANANSVDPRVINAGKVLAATVRSAYQKAELGGVFKTGEGGMLDNAIPDPSKFVPSVRVIPQLSKVVEETGNRQRSFLQSRGFTGQQEQGQQQGGSNNQPSIAEGSTSVNAKGNPIIYQGGYWRKK